MDAILKKSILITVLLAVVLILTVSFSWFFATRTHALSESEARRIAETYLPSDIHFISANEGNNEYELIYFDTTEGRSYRIQVSNPDGKLNAIYAVAVSAEEGSTIEIQRQEIESILEEQFPGAILENLSFEEGSTSGLGSIRINFNWESFSGTMNLNSESGRILEYNLKTAAQIVIPVENNEGSTRYLTSDEASLRAAELLTGATIHDVELDINNNRFVYEIFASDDSFVYVLSMDAETGDQISRQSTRQDWVQLSNGTDATDTELSVPTARPATEPATEPSSLTAPEPSPATTEPTQSPALAPTTQTTTGPQAVITLPSYEDDWEEVVKNSPQVSRDRAIEIALSRVSGAGTQHIEDVELDDDDGRLQWEIEIEYQDRDYDVIVDAHSGEILKFEADD